MPQLDPLIIGPIIVSMILILIVCYYLVLQLTIKNLKTLKFRTKLKNLKNPSNILIKLKDITYFENDKRKK